MYAVNREAIHGHVMALASLLPLCDTPEKISLLSLLGPIARNQPALLEASLPQLCDCLSVPSAVPATLQLLAEMATYKASLLIDYAPRIKEAVESSPSVVCLAAQVIARLGQVNEDRGREALDFIVQQITEAENHNIPSLLREVASLCSSHPALLTERLMNKLESYVEAAPSVAKNIYHQMKSNLMTQRSGNKNAANVTVLKVNGEHQQSAANNLHRLSLPPQGFNNNMSSVGSSTGNNNRASVGGFVNVGNMTVPISVASAVFSGTPVYNSQGIPVLLTFGPGGLNITNPSASGGGGNNNSINNNNNNNRAVGNRTKQADASRSTPRLTPPSSVPGSSAVAAAVMNRSMSWINAVHMNSTNRLSPSPAGPVLPGKGNMGRFGSSHQMALGANVLPYGPSREAHGPGIHNPNQGGRGAVFARGSRGSLSTNRVQVSGGNGPTAATTVTVTNPMRSVSGSLTTMKEDPEADLRLNNLMFGHVSNVGTLAGMNHMSPSPTIALSPMGRIQNQTPISMIPSSLSSLAPSPPPIGQHAGLKMHDDRLIHPLPSSIDIQHHKASMNTLASQSTLSFHNSSVTLSNPAGQLPPPPQQQQQQVVVRRNHGQPPGHYSGHPNGDGSNRNDDVSGVGLAASQRISVFEPYPMQDAVKHFCDKHLDKIKAYMERLMARLPLPVKCTIEERRSKKHAKVHFTCQGKSEFCLYGKSLFALKTKHPRLWIHLMFLALQVLFPFIFDPFLD